MAEKEKDLNEILHSYLMRDSSLSYLSLKEKEGLQCFGMITHFDINVLHAFFSYFQAIPYANISLLVHEEDASIWLFETREALLLFSDKEILSPSLFSKAMAVLLYRFYIFQLCNKNSISMDSFSIERLEVLISSLKDVSCEQKDTSLNNFHLQIEYGEQNQALLFKHSEKIDLYTLLKGMSSSYIEIAIPISKIGAEKVSRKHLVPLSKLEQCMQFYKQFGDKHTLKLFEIQPIVLEEHTKNSDETTPKEEYIIDFTEKRIDEKTTELIPLVNVDSFFHILPSVSQMKAIGFSMSDVLQRKIYLFLLKLIGSFSPLSSSFYNDTFFSKEIVIQMGGLIEQGMYYEQDNLVVLPPVLAYFKTLMSHNNEVEIAILEHTRK